MYSEKECEDKNIRQREKCEVKDTDVTYTLWSLKKEV